MDSYIRINPRTPDIYNYPLTPPPVPKFFIKEIRIHLPAPPLVVVIVVGVVVLDVDELLPPPDPSSTFMVEIKG